MVIIAYFTIKLLKLIYKKYVFKAFNKIYSYSKEACFKENPETEDIDVAIKYDEQNLKVLKIQNDRNLKRTKTYKMFIGRWR